MNPLLQKALQDSGGVPDLSKLAKPNENDPNGVAIVPITGRIDGKNRILGQLALRRWVHHGWLEGTALAVGLQKREEKKNDKGEVMITEHNLVAVSVTRDIDMLKYYLRREPEKVKQAKKEIAEEEKKQKEQTPPSEPLNNKAAGNETNTASKKR